MNSAGIYATPLFALLLAAGTVGSATAEAADIDPAHTRIGFTLKTRWGEALRLAGRRDEKRSPNSETATIRNCRNARLRGE